MKFRTKILCVAGACALGLVACSSGRPSASGGGGGASGGGGGTVPTITIGMPGALPVYAPLYVAQSLGYFKDAKVDVNIVTLSGLAQCVPPMVAGSVDACTSDPVSISQAKNSGIKIIATMSDPTVNALNVAPSIKNWSDLKGKTIAASSNVGSTASNISIQALMAAHGLLLSNHDYTLLAVGASPARFAALKSGKVAAAITTAPQQYQAAAAGYRVIGTSAQNHATIGNYMVTVPGKTNAQGISRLVTALRKASGWISDPANKAKALPLFAKLFTMSDQDSGEFYTDWITGLHAFSERAVSLDSISKQIDLYNRFSTTPAPETAAQLVDTQFAGS
jgi:ABC-type nitrate/sulfonate/bicarbonate transport system substrate-binding protein